MLFAFGMSAFISDVVFERLPHLEDELAYLFQARTYARGDLVIDTPEARRSFWQPFVLDRAGVRFGKYTPGWSLLLAGGVLLDQAWIINAWCAALSVALVYRLGRAIFNRDTGLIAAALVAFSPMALLLNASLMGHTSALMFVLLFYFAYWRLERGRWALLCGVIAGMALGMVIAARPLTAVAAALPLVAWSGVRLLRALITPTPNPLPLRLRLPEAIFREGAKRLSRFIRILSPLIALTIIALGIGALVPIYNVAAVGDPFANLYTEVWEYDSIGFGECCGRNGHTLERGIRHLRFDIALTAADLFGWQWGSIDDAARAHLLTESTYYPHVGLSFILLPFAFVVIWRRRSLWVIAWAAALIAAVIVPFEFDDGRLTRDPAFAWRWLIGALAWALLPLIGLRGRAAWTWLLWTLILSIIGVQLAYWIGSQRYSTRYYFEALGAAALLSAIPLAWLAQRFGRVWVYGAISVVLAISLFTYALPRIEVLRGYNQITRAQIEEVERRANGQPALVIVNGTDVRWRAFGALMAVTSPYLDSPIVAAWNYAGGDGAVKQQLIALFPDRVVIEIDANGNNAVFVNP